MCYLTFKKPPLFVCSLESEKCFDSLWHHALLFKLIDEIPDQHGLTLLRWYLDLKAMVRWNGVGSDLFDVSRGTRQGSLLSPCIFNVFLNDLLFQLAALSDGVRLGDAYADDVHLLCYFVPGLQRLIDICYECAKTWRLKFGIKKAKCFISSKHAWFH